MGPNLVTDAHLAALAIEHQAKLHSNDGDFARFSGLTWRNPVAQTRFGVDAPCAHSMQERARLPSGALPDSAPLLIITPCRQSPKEITQMASTKERLTQLADEHLDLGSDPDFDAQLADAGVSSVAAVAFFKEVNEAFNLSLQAEDCLQFRTLGILAAYIDDHSN